MVTENDLIDFFREEQKKFNLSLFCNDFEIAKRLIDLIQSQPLTKIEDQLRNRTYLFPVNNRVLGIKGCAGLIRSMPLDQAIQEIKSKITNLPETQVIKGELAVVLLQ